MLKLKKHNVMIIFIENLIDNFFSWFWKTKAIKNIDIVNHLIDKLLFDNFHNLKTIFQNEDEEKIFNEYISILNSIKYSWKNRYINFSISDV